MFILTPNHVQYLPPLGDVPPEARLNLVIHHLRHNDVGEALSLVKDLEPTSPQEYILKVGEGALMCVRLCTRVIVYVWCVGLACV